jgi:thiol:disulfide interchange protein
VEEHSGKVIWRAPVQLPAGVDVGTWKVEVEAKGQACKNVCVQFNEKVKVKLVGFQATSAERSSNSDRSGAATLPRLAQGKPGPYRPKTTHCSIDITSTADTLVPGGRFTVIVAAIPEGPFHVYALANSGDVDAGVNKPTVIGLELPKGWKRDAAKPDRDPDESKPDAAYYREKIGWSIPVHIPADAKPGDYAIRGHVGFQVCNDEACEAPTGAQFQIIVSLGGSPRVTAAEIAPAKYTQAAEWAERNSHNDSGDAPWVPRDESAAPADGGSRSTPAAVGPSSGDSNGGGTEPPPAPAGAQKFETQTLDGSGGAAGLTLFAAIGLAFLGGFSLNFMPCVLPVIGLKVLSFVSQSHGSRKQIFVLNLTYSLGIISVFLGLAAVAITSQLGWGEQFNSAPFTIVLACLVFAFALSMLGVWEIPIPGFVGSGSTAKMAEREGPFGAFCKGILTTLLATPCTGPFMGSALTWSVQQPPATTFLTFASLGVGMAAPYLVIGVFPAFVKFLPKPGMWMETFKQVMGFVLLATVAFIFSFLKSQYVAATFGLLVGIWAACWWIGRTSITAEIDQKLKAWAAGIAMAAGVGYVSFALLVPHKFWTEFTTTAFEESLQSGKIVLVDFTAEWCLVCKANERLAINVEETNRLLARHEVITFRADYTGERPEIAELMNALGHTNHQLPLYAVFPAPGKPVILFEGPITRGTIAQAIDKAVEIRENRDTKLVSGPPAATVENRE